MERNEILEKVKAAICETLGNDDLTITEETTLKDLGADSFELLELVTSMEDEFDLTFDDEALESIATIRDAVDAIESAQ